MSADNNIQHDQQAREAALTTDQSAEEFFFKHAQKNGRTLQEGDHGYALQEAAKARADNATIAERLADSPQDSSATAQADVHPSLQVPSSPLAYFAEIPIGTEPEHRQEASEVGGWLRSAGIPTATGNLLAKAAAAVGPMTEQELALASRSVRNNLKQAWGKDYQANLAGLFAAIDREDQKSGGKTWEWLNRNPQVMTNPVFVKQLASSLQRKR